MSVTLYATFTDYLDADTIKAIKDRYPTHQRNFTSDKKFLNMVMAEVCCAVNWKWNNKNNRWIVDNTKLEVMGKLFASIRNDSSIEHQEENDDNYEFIVADNGHEEEYDDEYEESGTER